MKFKATFHQSVEGVETVEVVVEADSIEEAFDLVESGDYSRYKVTNNDFTRVKHIGTVEIDEID